MKKILLTAIIMATTGVFAQVKVGSNPTTLATNAAGTADDANFQVEGETASGNQQFVILQNGNVGIGTTTPGAKLDVVGTVKIVDGTQGAGKVLTSDASGNATWQAAPGTSGSGVTVSVTTISPIHSSTGKVWMDRNLGASRRAQSVDDYLAYGQLYQWGRGNDGHADITWTSATAGTPVNGTTTTLSTTDYPDDNLFILQPASPSDWRATQNDNLWQGVSGVNNPCPAGYRLPTNTELTAEVTAYSITNSASAFASPLKFTVPGYRDFGNGTLYDVGSLGSYWSSSVTGTSASNRYFNSVVTNASSYYRAGGLAVRCLKD